MKTITQAISDNGGKKKSKNIFGTETVKASDDVDLDQSFSSRELLYVLTEVKNGNFNVRMPIDEVSLSGKINDTINQMITNLRQATLRNQEESWLKSNLTNFAVMLQGQKDLGTLTKQILTELAQVVSAHYGAFYILQTDGVSRLTKLKLNSVYAYQADANIAKEFSLGEGLVGQCAIEKKQIFVTNVPGDYHKISSGLGKAIPTNLIIFPVLFENKVKAVIELASFNSFNTMHLAFLNSVTEGIGTVLNTIESFARTAELLEQAQSQAGELKIRQEELRITNDKLQEKALLLLKQNEEVEKSRKLLEERAEQLTLTSKYKSEFLANMSHELRSPLNSLLILAQQLYENAQGNLSEKQVRFAKTIYSCGDDLIQLINDILDLSKIESGSVSLNISTVRIADIALFVETTYKPVSDARNLKFSIEIDNDVPASIDTDTLRLNQVLKNLLSNAFKFTEVGEVSLRISIALEKTLHPRLDKAKKVISFSISDTGIGIPADKQHIIFEAFQQAEGSTSRKYGGTGLGLSISRGLIELLGGAIELDSEVGRGSKFTLFIPLENAVSTSPSSDNPNQMSKSRINTEEEDYIEIAPPATLTEIVEDNYEEIAELNEAVDDRTNLKPGDQVVLVVEDDLRFGNIIVEKAHEHGLKALLATNFMEVFDLVNLFHPIAITLDVNLPATSGWKVIQLMQIDLAYCHIPIHVISGEENRILAMKKGARSFLLKPLENELLNQLFQDIISYSNKKTWHILVVEDNEIDASQIAKILSDVTINVTVAKTCKYAIELISKKDYDCIILDYSLPDVPGIEVIHQINAVKKLFTPVIIYSLKDFNGTELGNVNNNSNSHVTKGVNSIEILLSETISQLHINHKDLSLDKRKIIENIRNKKDILSDKKILIVDDDMRNLFAMTTVFERFDMKVATAEGGQEALSILEKNPMIEMVLMDIMMPGMDGYETTQKIRHVLKRDTLPIIAVTAKAMKRDREKCIEAGASDYITKPVKIDQLLSLMRLWFCKQ